MAEEIPGGYNGKILRVDLSNSAISVESIDSLFCRKYLGGAGFITYFLLKELPPTIDPLSPDNQLIFALGPVTGMNIIGSGRNGVGAKSPLSGGIALSEVGEYWGAELKRAGYDAIIIEGKADRPAFLWVCDGEASLMDAGHLWGKETRETQQSIRSELGDQKIRVAMIGPGGEKMTRFACIMNGLYDAAGRGGLGAVMGSKNLKAIAVRGHKPPAIANADRLKDLRRWYLEILYKAAVVKGWHETGTGFDMEVYEAVGDLPIRNWRDGSFPGVKKIGGTAIKDTIGIGMDACFSCPVRCKKKVKFSQPYPVEPDYGGPEYETLSSLGSNCGVDDLKAIAKGNEICNANSLDTISTGGVIAFAMECFENGLLTIGDTGGIELRFGNAGAMLKCVELIAKRDGFGDVLAEGTTSLAKRIGHDSAKFAIHVKGVDPGQHDPRLSPSMGLGFMVNPHGADHCCNMLDGKFTTESGMKSVKPLGFIEPFDADDIGPRKVALFKAEQSKQIILDCLLMCHLAAVPLSLNNLADITACITGWDTGVVEQMKVAERVLTMARLFNIKQGFSADDDILPERYFQPKHGGALATKSLNPRKMDKAKRYYYNLMGWDYDTGIPLAQKLEELGIS